MSDPTPASAEAEELPDTDAVIIECSQKPLSCTLGLRLKIRAFVRETLPTLGPLEEIHAVTMDGKALGGRQTIGRTAVSEEWPGHFRKYHAEFHEVLQHLSEIDRASATEASAWRTVVQNIRHAEHEGTIAASRRAWEIEDGRMIIWTPRGISLKIDRGNSEVTLPVIAGFLKPERRVIVENWTYFEVKLTPTQIVTSSADDLLDRLDRDGRIRKRRLGHDVLVEVLNEMSVEGGVAYPVYGIFPDPAGNLSVCRTPVPVREEQILAQQQMEDGIGYQPTAADFQAYFDFVAHFDPYEVFPAMGLAAISPLAHTLRGADLFVPHVWHYSLAHGLGKSLVALAFSRQLWARSPATGSGINSEFRLCAHLDAASAPLCVEEGERLNIDRLGPDIKTSAERPIVSRRGSTILTMFPYASRCVLFVSGNRLAPRSGPVLSRFLAPRFNSSRIEERRKNKARMDTTFARLRPIGHSIAVAAVQQHSVLSSVILRIREVEHAIADSGAAQGDIRRAQMWAVVYVGLELWGAAAAATGASWSPPSIPAFVQEVVRPVDQSTYESEETVVDAFRSWFEVWRSRNVVKASIVHVGGGRNGREEYERTEEIRGRGQIFDDTIFRVDPKRTIHGYWITQPLITEYNRQAIPDLVIGSLKELAISAADQADIPYDLVLDPEGVVRRTQFGERRVRAAFVARDRDLGGDERE